MNRIHCEKYFLSEICKTILPMYHPNKFSLTVFENSCKKKKIIVINPQKKGSLFIHVFNTLIEVLKKLTVFAFTLTFKRT